MTVEKNKVLHINAASFEKAINSGVCLVDFWAEWCAPCRMQGPILDEIASQPGNNALIAKINVDDNRQIAAKYGIMSIPTIIIFNKGQIAKQFVGVQSASVLQSALKNL